MTINTAIAKPMILFDVSCVAVVVVEALAEGTRWELGLCSSRSTTTHIRSIAEVEKGNSLETLRGGSEYRFDRSSQLGASAQSGGNQSRFSLDPTLL